MVCVRSYTFCYTFLYVPGGLLSFLFMVAWPLVCLGNPHATRAAHTRYTSCATLMLLLVNCYTFLYVLSTLCIHSPWKEQQTIKSYTFLNVLRYPSRNSCKVCCGVIRSYTFESRSYTFCRSFVANVSKSYTFLYVLRYPSRTFCKGGCKVIRSYTFQSRSYTFSRSFVANVSKSYTFLYVPRHPSCICCKM